VLQEIHSTYIPYTNVKDGKSSLLPTT